MTPDSQTSQSSCSKRGYPSRRGELLALGICCLLGIGLLLPARITASGPLYAPTQRFGVGLVNSHGDVTAYDIADWGIGWYSDWSRRESPPRPSGMEYVQMVRVSSYPPDWQNLSAAILSNPGSLWIVGNEPECVYQDNLTPAEYAVRYHGVYQFIKSEDPSAQVAIGGVVQPTPLRLHWLDLARQAYQDSYGQPMPVDVWNIHVQILQEKRGSWGCDIPAGLPDDEGRLYTIEDNANAAHFEQLVGEFCQWLVDRGERDKPLIISEYGVLMPSEYLGADAAAGDAVVKAFMTGTFDFLLSATDATLGYADDDNRLVQRWLWFSLNEQPYDPGTGAGFNGGLFDWQDPSQITTFGIAFRDYMYALQGERFELPLCSGWNLISTPLVPPVAGTTQVLYTLASYYDLVYGYDASDAADPWKKYNTAAPSFLNDLTEINERMGLWIRAGEATTLYAFGSIPSASDISLYTGWNLVGYPSQTTRPITEALASIEGKYDLVYAYDGWDAADPWKKYNVAAPPFLNDLTEMGPGWGYWIRVSEDCVWSVP